MTVQADTGTTTVASGYTNDHEEGFATVDAKSPAKGFLTWLKRLVGFYPRSGPVPLEKKDVTDSSP